MEKSVLKEGNTTCLAYCGFLGLWCGDRHTTASSGASGSFEMKLFFFSVIFSFLKSFLGTNVEVVYRCRRQENFFFGKKQNFRSILEDFQGQRLSRFTSAVCRNFF